MKNSILSMWLFAIVPIVGEGVVSIDPSDAPAICKLTIPKNGMETICSGTLISDTQIVTAGHCFGENYSLSGRVRVTCDGEIVGYGKSLSLPPKSEWIYNDHSGERVPTPGRDFAILTLSSNRYTKEIPVVKVLRDPSLVLDGVGIRSDAECAIYGYGLNNAGGVGRLMKADLKSVMFSVQKGILVMRSRNASDLKTSPDHGDSGGPLICKSPVDHELYQVAVNGSFHVRKHDLRDFALFAPIWLNLSNL